MASFEVHGSMKNLSAAPDIEFQFQPNGQPWASVIAAHNGCPEAYRAVGKLRFVFIEGDMKEYWYKGGVALENLVRRYENLDDAQAYVDQLEALKAETEELRNDAEDWAKFAGANYEEKGDYNVATNTPPLTANATIGQSNPDKLQRYLVTVGGPLAFDIKDMPAGSVIEEGYLVQHPNGQWMYDAKDSAALGRVIALEEKAVTAAEYESNIGFSIEDENALVLLLIDKNGKLLMPAMPKIEDFMLSEEVYKGLVKSTNIPGMKMAVSDQQGNVVWGIMDDGTVYPQRLEPIRYSNLSDGVRNQMLVQQDIPGFVWAVLDEKKNVITGITTTGQVYPPTPIVQTEQASNISVKDGVNQYPHVTAKLRRFASRFLGQTAKVAGDNVVCVVALGDSIFARMTHTSLGSVVPANNPPGLTTNSFLSQLFAGIDIQKPLLYRYDSAGVFTETGTFTSLADKANWDDNGMRQNETRVSTDVSAAVSFTLPADVVQCNWIDRTATDGAAVNTISATGGQVEVMLPGTETWVEANGTTFSQVQTAGTRIGNTTYQRRIQFRRKTGVSGALTVTITKDTSSNALMYWGVERLKNNNAYLQLINAARGGRTLEQLTAWMENDVIQRKPDLVILEIPLINMIATNSSLSYNLNWVQDFVWGDRPGFENTWSLKAKSNNWLDFEVLLIIPHATRDQMNMDKTWKVQASGYTAPEIYNAVKGLIFSKGDVPFIDIFRAFKNHADKYYPSYFDAVTGTSATGATLTTDNIHPNDRGTAIYADLISLFTLSSF